MPRIFTAAAVFLVFSPLSVIKADFQDWQPVFEDEFSTPALSENWRKIDGDWRIENGELVGRGQLLLNLELTDAQRITFDARSEKPGDFSAILGAAETGFASGYFLGFASDNNQSAKLLIKSKRTAEAPGVAEPNKVYHIEAERDGHRLTLIVNGETVLSHEHEIPLAGNHHPYVGLYMYSEGTIDNVRIYTKSDALSDDARAIIATEEKNQDRPLANNLIANGDFEMWRTGILNMPADFSTRFFDRGDDAKWIDDPSSAHTGRGSIRLKNEAGVGVTLDAIPADGIRLEPGKTYEISCWAKSLSGQPTLAIEPGNYVTTLTTDWQQYRTSYMMPKDADPQIGFFVRLKHGEAIIDDLAMVPAGQLVRWPEQTLADRTGLIHIEQQTQWHRGQRDPAWTARVPIVFSELFDEPANNVIAKLKFSDVLQDIWYSGIGQKSIKIVDAETGRRVPHVVVDADRFPGSTAEDEIVFPVNIPARSCKTYYFYYTTERDAQPHLLDELPLRMARPSKYKHALEFNIEPAQLPVAITKSEQGYTLTLYEGEPESAQAISPDTLRAEPLTLTPVANNPGVWLIDCSPIDEPGVWSIEVSTTTGKNVSQAIIHQHGIWAANNTSTLHDEPIHDASWIQLSAARGEREAFAAMIRSDIDLINTNLYAEDLIATEGESIISASDISIEFAERIHITMPWPVGRRAGWYRDPLVPWATRDIPANTSELAWVTVHVPSDAAPGEYWSRLVVTTDEGEVLELPICLEVFDFTLPSRIDFAAVLGGDIWEKIELGYHLPQGENNPYRDLRSGEATLALARLLSQHHASPFYYHHDKSPYAVPWHYDPATGEATFDFSRLDQNLETMINQWNVREIFFGGKFAGGWQNPGTAYDWSKDLDKAWERDWEQAYPQHKAKRDTPKGQRMVKAYAAGIAQHLYDRGWLDHAYLYVTDEDKTDKVREVAKQTIETIHETEPRLNTLVISNAEHRYPDYLETVDAFAGLISDEHLARYQKNNKRWWGSYNGGGLPTMPLSVTRALGARNWRVGSTGYVNWAAWRKPDMLVETNTLTYLPPNAGYPAKTFVTNARFDFTGMGTWLYPWPSWEPIDASRDQTLFIGSLRLAAFREAVEDYEYLRRASAMIDHMRPDAQGDIAVEQPLAEMRELIDTSHVRVLKFDYFDVNPKMYYRLRTELGRHIADAK